MKKFLKMLVEQTSEFVTNHNHEREPVKFSPIVSMIQLALQKKSGVHVIFQDKSFTGDIVKYDQERQQVIIKNFRKSMSTIIRVADIKRIRLVPNPIKKAQQSSIKLQGESKNSNS